MPSRPYSAGVGSNPAGTTLRRGACTPIAVTTAANNIGFGPVQAITGNSTNLAADSPAAGDSLGLGYTLVMGTP